jgi:hypothetical protein
VRNFWRRGLDRIDLAPAAREREFCDLYLSDLFRTFWSDLRKCLILRLLALSKAPRDGLASDFHPVVFSFKASERIHSAAAVGILRIGEQPSWVDSDITDLSGTLFTCEFQPIPKAARWDSPPTKT